MQYSFVSNKIVNQIPKVRDYAIYVYFFILKKNNKVIIN